MKKWIITDIDNTLIGDDLELLKFLSWHKKNQYNIGFAVATGRNINSTFEVLNKNNIQHPQVLITSVGAEIYYFNNNQLEFDKEWQSYVGKDWNPIKIKELLKDFNFLSIHDDQREFKVGYYIHEINHKKIKSIKDCLKKAGLKYKVIVAERKYLDIVPRRVSKYNAIKHVCKNKGINVKDVLVVGDSGNDRDMLSKMPNSVVVKNHQKEISNIKNVYFSSKNNAGAILDGLSYYKIV